MFSDGSTQPRAYCRGRNAPSTLFWNPVRRVIILLMDKILHDPKDPKLWELWYILYNG